MKLPAMQFYVGDWRKDPAVQALSFHDRGVWFEMLCLMFESPERGRLVLKDGVPMPEAALARLLGMERAALRRTLATLAEYAVVKVEPHTGILYNRRMVADAELSRKRAACGRLGGNPFLLNQSGYPPKNLAANQTPTPSSSPSTSSSKKRKTRARGDEGCLKTHADSCSKKFEAPLPNEVAAYAESLGGGVDADRFCDYYAAKGWLVGRSPMRDWRAAVRAWKRNAVETHPIRFSNAQATRTPFEGRNGGTCNALPPPAGTTAAPGANARSVLEGQPLDDLPP